MFLNKAWRLSEHRIQERVTNQIDNRISRQIWRQGGNLLLNRMRIQDWLPPSQAPIRQQAQEDYDD